VNPSGTNHGFGVAKIDYNDGDGDYTITQLWWNPDTSDYDSAVKPAGFVTRSARDILGRDTGAPGDRVYFWAQERKDAQVEYLIDILQTGICWGKATADYVSGDTVTLDPCDADGNDNGLANVTSYVVTPVDADEPSVWLSPEIYEDDILAYLPFGENKGVLLNPKWKHIGPDSEGNMAYEWQIRALYDDGLGGGPKVVQVGAMKVDDTGHVICTWSIAQERQPVI